MSPTAIRPRILHFVLRFLRFVTCSLECVFSRPRVNSSQGASHNDTPTAPTLKDMTMTTTVRALIFGAAIAAVSALTLTAVFAAEPVKVVRLDGVTVIAHRDHFDCDG